MRVCVDVPGPCCDLVVSQGCAIAGVWTNCVASAVTWDHGIVWTRALTMGHVWTQDPIVVVVWDVHSFYCHHGLFRCLGSR